MDTNTDNNKDKAELFLAHVREQVEEQMERLPLSSLKVLLTSLVAYAVLRDLKVDAGDEVEPELAQLADAAVYFLKEAGLNMKFSTGHEE